MSKSVGNFITVHELLKDWPGEVLRFNMLKTHYRQPIDWTRKGLEEAHKVLKDFYKIAHQHKGEAEPHPEIIEALSDDLNTPWVRSILSKMKKDKDFAAIAASLKFLGFSVDPAKLNRNLILKAESGNYTLSGQPARMTVIRADGTMEFDSETNERIEQLIAARIKARSAKDWAEADRIRDELNALKIVIQDSKNPDTGEFETTWEVG